MQKPDFSHEKKLWKKGYRFVIGVDEVGRGAFAGPVVAAAAAVRIARETELGKDTSEVSAYLPAQAGTPPRWREKVASKLLKQISSLGINDSKKLSSKKREELEKEIKKYFYSGIGEGSVTEINRLGIVKATEKAMRRAVKRIKNQELRIKNKNKRDRNIHNSNFLIPNSKCFLLLDAFHVKYIPGVGLKSQKAIVHGDQRSISIAAASILAKVYRDNLMCRFSSQYKKYHWKQNKGYGTKNHREQIARFGIIKLHRKKFVEKWV